MLVHTFFSLILILWIASRLCTGLNCTGTLNIANGSNGNCLVNTISGVSCTPSCNMGYTATTNPKLNATCLLGNWSVSGGCKPNPCISTPNITNGYAGSCTKNTSSGVSCIPICRNGYTATTNPSLNATCYLGNWSVSGECKANPCISTPNITNGNPGNCKYNASAGSSCTPACNSGYTPNPLILKATCILGNWSVNGTCEEESCKSSPALIANATQGNCDSVPINSRSSCTQVCNTNFTQYGSLTFTCNKGVFDNPGGECVQDCFLSDMKIQYSTDGNCSKVIPSGTYCMMRCDNQYIPNQQLQIFCNRSKLVYNQSAHCVSNVIDGIHYCSQPTPYYPVSVGNCSLHIAKKYQCTMNCFPGYTPSLYTNFTTKCSCTTTNTFNTLCSMTSANPQCLPNVCPPLTSSQIPANSKNKSCILDDKTPLNTTCSFACDNKYYQQGSLTTTCVNATNGPYYPNITGSCIPKNCTVDYKSSKNSTNFHNCSSTVLNGSYCTPQCNPGYSANGSLTQQCVFGKFSSPLGYCIPTPCQIPFNQIFTPVSVLGNWTMFNTTNFIDPNAQWIGVPSSSYDFSTSKNMITFIKIYYSSIAINNTHISAKGDHISSILLNGKQLLINNTCKSDCVVYGNITIGTNRMIVTAVKYLLLSVCENLTNNNNILFHTNNSWFYNNTNSFPINVLNTSSCNTSMVSYISNGSICTPTCSMGYTASGNLTVRCATGDIFQTNTTNPGICIASDCAPPQSTVLRIYKKTVGKCNEFTAHNSSCKLDCMEGYIPFGDMSIRCMNGIFDFLNSKGYCVALHSIYTDATSTISPPLIGSPGTALHLNLSYSINLPNSTYYTIRIANTTKLVNYSATSRRIYIPNMGVYFNETYPIHVNISIPPINIFNMSLGHFIFSYYPIPTLTSSCPTSIKANVTQTVVVQGVDFADSGYTLCVLNMTYSLAQSIQGQSVTCNVFWNAHAIQPNSRIELYVVNDGVASSLHHQTPLILTIAGTCETTKPNSIPYSGDCVCPAGFEDKKDRCTECPDTYYQQNIGKDSCIPCGDGESTNGKTGSTSRSACVCVAARYNDTQTNMCKPCADGMYCPGNNIIKIKPGYWRSGNSTVVIACPGGTASCKGTLTGKDDELCQEGYKGPLCVECSYGYAKFGKVCQSCPNVNLNNFVLLILTCLTLAYVYFFIRLSTAFSDDKNDNDKAVDLGDVRPIAKVLLNYLQVLFYVSQLSVKWPYSVSGFFTIIGQSAMSSNMHSVQCLLHWKYYERLVFVYMSPIIITVILAVTYYIRYRYYHMNIRDSLEDAQLGIMLMLYLIHPTIMLDVVSSLPCEYVPGTDTSYLRADMSVDCHTREYKSFAKVSWVYLTFYVFGMMILLLYRGLYHNAKSGKLHEEGRNAFRKYAFFVRGYRPSAYYWEIVVMGRKLAIVALSVVTNGTIQLLWSGIIITSSIIGNMFFTPFTDSFVNRLETLSLLCINITIVIGVHFAVLNPTSDSGGAVILIMINTLWAIYLFYMCFKRARNFLQYLAKSLISSFIVTRIWVALQQIWSGFKSNCVFVATKKFLQNRKLMAKDRDDETNERRNIEMVDFNITSFNKPLLSDQQIDEQ